MNKQEFEAIAKREVTSEQYKAIEALYMESTMNKYDFVASIKPMLKGLPEPAKSEEVVALEKRINDEIKEMQESIEFSKSKIAMYEWNYADDKARGLSDAKIWKEYIKSEREWVKHCKNRINALKWVLS